jgi:hypothetical protein
MNAIKHRDEVLMKASAFDSMSFGRDSMHDATMPKQTSAKMHKPIHAAL